MTAASNSEARKRAQERSAFERRADGHVCTTSPACCSACRTHDGCSCPPASEGAAGATKDAAVDSGAIGRLNEAEREVQPRRYSASEEFAATVACLLAGRMDGQQAVATLTAIHEGILREHTDRALAEVERRIKAAMPDIAAPSLVIGYRGGMEDARIIVRAARQEQGR
jgi:hypothetical protein